MNKIQTISDIENDTSYKISKCDKSIIDYIITLDSSDIIEFHGLYENPYTDGKNYEEEKIKIEEYLKSKGFRIKATMIGYMPTIPKMKMVRLENKEKTCRVEKKYSKTWGDSLLYVTETIQCEKRKPLTSGIAP